MNCYKVTKDNHSVYINVDVFSNKYFLTYELNKTTKAVNGSFDAFYNNDRKHGLFKNPPPGTVCFEKIKPIKLIEGV